MEPVFEPTGADAMGNVPEVHSMGPSSKSVLGTSRPTWQLGGLELSSYTGSKGPWATSLGFKKGSSRSDRSGGSEAKAHPCPGIFYLHFV